MLELERILKGQRDRLTVNELKLLRVNWGESKRAMCAWLSVVLDFVL